MIQQLCANLWTVKFLGFWSEANLDLVDYDLCIALFVYLCLMTSVPAYYVVSISAAVWLLDDAQWHYTRNKNVPTCISTCHNSICTRVRKKVTLKCNAYWCSQPSINCFPFRQLGLEAFPCWLSGSIFHCYWFVACTSLLCWRVDCFSFGADWMEYGTSVNSDPEISVALWFLVRLKNHASLMIIRDSPTGCSWGIFFLQR